MVSKCTQSFAKCLSEGRRARPFPTRVAGHALSGAARSQEGAHEGAASAPCQVSCQEWAIMWAIGRVCGVAGARAAAHSRDIVLLGGL